MELWRYVINTEELITKCNNSFPFGVLSTLTKSVCLWVDV